MKKHKATLWIIGVTLAACIIAVARFNSWPAGIVIGSIGGVTAAFQWCGKLFPKNSAEDARQRTPTR